MALSQRLQIRQSQALVMTPQLMQAIKLLQLSNLDLVAYVEAELERNPLLDRSAETEPAPGEPGGPQSPADQPAANGEALNGQKPRQRSQRSRRRGSAREPARRHLSRRQRADPAAQFGYAGRLFGMGGHRLRRPRRRRLQSRSLRFRRDHAGGLAARANDACHRRAGAAHDRAVSDRSRRRVRLSLRRYSPRRRKSSAPAPPKSKPSSPSCKLSIRPASARATSPNAWRSSSRSSIATIRRCRR